MSGTDEEIDGVLDAEPEAEAEAEAEVAAVNEEELEGDTSKPECVSDGDNDAWGTFEGDKKLDGDTSA